MRLWQPKLPSSYEEQTHASPYWIVRFPHRRRIGLAVKEIRRQQAQTLLDYGSGDAYLIERLAMGGSDVPRTTLYEPVEHYAEKSRRTVARLELDHRVDIITHLSECDGMQFECIACLEVLEHMPLPQRNLFYETCQRHLAPGGACIIDVPVEVGPTLLIKELARRVLKGREPEYSNADLLRRSLGRRVHDPQRFDPSNNTTWIHYHTDFDYRELRDELGRHFRLDRSFGSPFPALAPPLGNQEAFIICHRG